jgi:hypothetical protein
VSDFSDSTGLLLGGASLKAALDCDRDDPKARQEGLQRLVMENEAISLGRLRCHMAKEHELRTAELDGNFRQPLGQYLT